MATYRIHRLKQHLQQQFRATSHVSGVANVKPRDYQPGPATALAPELIAETVEAATPYSVYFALRDSETPLVPGDVLETESGTLSIYKYVGFEEARWVYPEPKPAVATEEVAEPVTGASAL